MLHRVDAKAVAVAEGNPILIDLNQGVEGVFLRQVDVLKLKEVTPTKLNAGVHGVFPNLHIPVNDFSGAGVPVKILKLARPDPIVNVLGLRRQWLPRFRPPAVDGVGLPSAVVQRLFGLTALLVKRSCCRCGYR